MTDVLMNAERRAVENGAEGSAPGGFLDLGFGSARSSQSDVLAERAREHEWILWHVADVSSQVVVWQVAQ
ncbi:Uncharacterised protein [Mycobacteroides abscessus subsp. abscessus]|nr:Uncharacterised protein [Mycobacteroides abscessus subsp. abscessus]